MEMKTAIPRKHLTSNKIKLKQWQNQSLISPLELDKYYIQVVENTGNETLCFLTLLNRSSAPPL